MVAFFFPPLVARNIAVVTDQGSFSNSWSLTTNITSVSFGTADTNRRVFQIVHWYGTAAGARTISSATIGGVSATVHTQTFNRDTGTSDTYGVAVISAAVPTGTSGTVSITFDASGTGTIVVRSVSAIGLVGSIVDAQSNHPVGAGTSTSVNVNVPSQGVIIFGSTAAEAITNITLTGTAGYSVNAGGGDFYAGKISTGEPANASKTLTASTTGGAANIGIAAITWRGG